MGMHTRCQGIPDLVFIKGSGLSCLELSPRFWRAASAWGKGLCLVSGIFEQYDFQCPKVVGLDTLYSGVGLIALRRRSHERLVIAGTPR